MGVQYVNDSLNNENELLQALVEYTRSYETSKFTGSGKFIAASWANFLNQRSETNANVSGGADLTNEYNEIKADMLAEIAQLDKYIEASDPDPQYSEKWKEFFICEKDILCKLLEKLDEDDC